MTMFKSTYILRRFSAANEDGCHPYEDFPVRLNVQSLNAKELQALPEGKRSFDRIKSFGKDEVHTVNQRTGTPADQLYCNGNGTSANRHRNGHTLRLHTGNVSGHPFRKECRQTRRRNLVQRRKPYDDRRNADSV